MVTYAMFTLHQHSKLTIIMMGQGARDLLVWGLLSLLDDFTTGNDF